MKDCRSCPPPSDTVANRIGIQCFQRQSRSKAGRTTAVPFDKAKKILREEESCNGLMVEMWKRFGLMSTAFSRSVLHSAWNDPNPAESVRSIIERLDGQR